MPFKIVLNGVTKIYDDRVVIDSVDYGFESGERYIIDGESGCGKTTLLNMIAGYVSCDKGNIEVNSKIAYLFQDELLFSNLTVKENLLIRWCALKENIQDFGEQIKDVLTKLKIENLLDKKVNMLSGGERQRVQLSSMLLVDPDIVLMDEPTVKLDEENKAEIIKLISEAFKNKTLIIVTHEAEKFNIKYKKLKMRNGKLYNE